MTALKGTWTVRAGVIPGEAMDEYTKQWTYTSADYDADCALPDEPRVESRFLRCQKESTDYYTCINDPRRINWAEATFIWW